MLGVVIPTLNEASTLEPLLDDLASQRGIDLQIVVADGGSTDDTTGVAARGGATIVRGARGRGAQMNAGRAACAQVPWLLFLHADSRFETPDQLAMAVALLATSGRACGHFALRFDAPDARFRFLEAKSTLNRPYTANGDQGLLVSAALFDELGGFDTRTPFMEDQRFAARSRAAGVQWITLPGRVTTSARRFRAEGFGARYVSMALIMAAWAGEAEEFLSSVPELYRPNPSTRLDLRPVLAGLRAVTRTMGPARAWRAWLKAATMARDNAWQLFFALDVALADEVDDATPFLDLYDRRVASLLDRRGVDVAIAAIAAVVLLGVMPAWLDWRVRRTG